MKRKINLIPLVLALALGLSVTSMIGCKKSESQPGAEQAHQYTCPMHPEVVKDKSGDCPKCGMKLVEKR